VRDAAAPEERRPIRLVVRDGDLHRNRLTVFFRVLLAIPHLVWVTLWGIAAFVVAFVLWLAVVINGEVPSSLHGFVEGYVRYATQVGAYVLLAADPYPGFRGAPGYDVDVEIDPPVRQGRWGGFFRLILALPALALATALGGGVTFGSPSSSWSSDTGAYEAYAATIGGVASIAAVLAWFSILARGRAPRGLRDLTAFALGYYVQAVGYLLLLTPRYPTSDPAQAEDYSALPRHPVRLVLDDDLRRSRLTVLFRLLLAIPHFVWLLLWSVAAVLAVFVAWFAALFTGRVPTSLHRFVAAYVRYGQHVFAFVSLVGEKFPGFTGRAGSYGVDAEIDPPEPQSRWTIFFRIFLAIPALLVSSALEGVALVIAVLGWFYAIARGRMPEGLRDLGASCLRYGTQTTAYLFLLTDRYPYAAPVLRDRPKEPERRTPLPMLLLPPPPPVEPMPMPGVPF
jgi:Domain of unknown function (DUF4389)